MWERNRGVNGVAAQVLEAPFPFALGSHYTLINSMKDGVVLLDETHQIQLRNQAVSKIAPDLLPPDGILTHLADLPVTEILDAILSGERRIHEETLELETTLQTLQLTFTPCWHDGRIKGVMLLVRDATRERELQDQLLQSEKLARIGHAFTELSHQLSNPLSVLSGYGQLLLNMTQGTKFHGPATKIFQAATQLQQMVQHVLDYVHVNRPNRARMNLNAIVRGTLDQMIEPLQNHGVLLRTLLDPALPDVFVDENEIRQALVNLLDNACQALGASGGEIEIRTEQREGRVHLSVADNGPGISPRHLDKIFDPFFTTKSRGKGTGLGLAITRSIAEGHNGSLHVESALGRGAKFTLILPALSRRASHARRAGKRVLIVEDDPYTARLLGRILEHKEFSVEITHDGQEALESLERETFDLIISDIQMPQMDGFSFFEALLRAHPELSGHVVFVTADAVEPEVQRFLQQHSLPCLTKPFSLENLSMILERVIEGGQAVS